MRRILFQQINLFVCLLLFLSSNSQSGSSKNKSISERSSSICDSLWNCLPKYPENPGFNLEWSEINRKAWVKYLADVEMYRRSFRQVGLVLWKECGNDKRRYNWLIQTLNGHPYYWRNIEAGANEQFNKIVYNNKTAATLDITEKSYWDSVYVSLKREFFLPGATTKNNRMNLEREELSIQLQNIEQIAEQDKSVALRTMLNKFRSNILGFASRYYKLYISNYSSSYYATDLIRGIVYRPEKFGFSFTSEDLGTFLQPFTKSPDSILKKCARGYLNLLALKKRPLELKFKDIKDRYVNINDYRGKVVLIDMWATWCTSCIANMPSIKDTYDKYKEQGFEVISICVNPSKDIEKVLKVEAKIGSSWPILLIGGNPIDNFHMDGLAKELWDTYGFNVVPQLLLLDKNGLLNEYGSKLSGKALEAEVIELLKLK